MRASVFIKAKAFSKIIFNKSVAQNKVRKLSSD